MFRCLIVLCLCAVELMHAAASGQLQPAAAQPVAQPARKGLFSCLKSTEDHVQQAAIVVQHDAQQVAADIHNPVQGLLSAGEGALLAALESDKFKAGAVGGLQTIFTAIQANKPVDEVAHVLGVTVTPGAAANTSVISMLGHAFYTFDPTATVNWADAKLVALITSISAHQAVSSVLAPAVPATPVASSSAAASSSSAAASSSAS